MYRNPVIPGFHPDPSICRVGEDYYLVTSTFEFFPGVPVFHSRDLVHWRQIGHCLTTAEQLPLAKAGASAGIFAPTLRYHSGRFYMVTTNVSRHQHVIVSTDDPAGEWSEPLWLEHGWIDPSLCFDDDGKVYFTSNGPGGILQSELDLAAGRFIGKPRVLWAGTGGRHVEAPHLYRIGDWYYLLVAEGGTSYGHMVTIARSASPWGPFEPCPHNPILEHHAYGDPIQCTGHGDLIADHRGNWWMVFLATRSYGYPLRHHLGRETCLAPVRWTAHGWPVVGDGGRVAECMEVEDALPPHPWPEGPERDLFDTPKLGLHWNFLRNPYPADWSLTARAGWLRLHGSSVTLDDEDSPAWVGRRQQHVECTATTELEFAPSAPTDEAGLTVYANPLHHYEIGVSRGRIVLRRRIGLLQAVVAERELQATRIWLRVSADRDWYRFSFSTDQGAWVALGEGEVRYLTTEVAGGFTGVYLAMYATGNGQRAGVAADFKWFEYSVQETPAGKAH